MKATRTGLWMTLFTMGMAQAAPQLAHFSPASTIVVGEPLITGIYVEDTNVLVTAQVPAGFHKVTLEGSDRLAGAPWMPKALARPNGQSGQLTFRLRAGAGLEVLRLRADASDALPDFFYAGASEFTGQPVSSAGGGVYLKGDSLSGVVAMDYGTPLTMVEASGPTPPRLVVESDIWKVNGDTLYFFNQYRGLQVIDISQPDQPVVTGTLPLSGAGEQMYLLDGSHVVLLVRDGCYTSSSADSQAIIVEILGGIPLQVAAVPISGTICESRLVGSALYVASRVYRYSANSSPGVWESGTLVSSYDLSAPRSPVARSSEWITGGYNAVISATDRFLFVAREPERYDSTESPVGVFDITAPDGTMSLVSTIRSSGRVKDKFKLNLDGDVLAIVSELQGPTTLLETFSLANPAAPVKLGSLKIIERETLFATRFDGDRLYVVTFRQIDPLWLIDLTDPHTPRIAGELQVPGFSTYLAPMGDRLLAIGRDTTGGSKTIVSLFNVENPANPALLKRVDLGSASWSYSEANSDEKALGVFPDEGLILVPFSSYTTGGSLQAVQLIDLQRDTLALRGQIEHPIQPRRATIHRDRILSLSGRELLSVDATDRDHPVVLNTTLLSWPVDQVFINGDYLVELSRAEAGGPVLRIAATGTPDAILGRVVLTNLPFLGATHHDNQVYIAQGTPAQIRYQWEPLYGTNRIVGTNWGVFSLTVLDTSQLPELSTAGQIVVPTDQEFSGQWTALWPKPGLLVWANGGSDYYTPVPLYRGGPMDPVFMPVISFPGAVFQTVTLTPVASVFTFQPSPQVITFDSGGMFVSSFARLMPIWRLPWEGGYWGWGGAQRFIAFAVTDSHAPALLSDVKLEASSNWGGSSQAFATNNLIYTSHREYETQVTGTNYTYVTNRVSQLVTNMVTVTNIISIPHYSWVTNIEPFTNLTTVMVLNRPVGFDSWQAQGPLTGILAAGGAHSLLVSPQNQLLAWGANGLGQLGAGAYSAGTDQISPIPGLKGIRAVSAGLGHTLALDADGSVWAWGSGSYGQLGGGAPATNWPPTPYLGSPTPARVLGLNSAISVAAGQYHSLALTADGSVWQWGADWADAAKDGLPQYTAKPVPGVAGVRAISGGFNHSLALLTDGSVWAWGRNDNAQLGYPPGPALSPGPVSGLPKAAAVAAGFWCSLALAENGTVWGWGLNQSGMLGNSTNSGSVVAAPVRISGLENVVAIATGRDHGLALKQDGSLWGWGSNERGQLGSLAAASSATPVRVDACSNVVSFAAGRWFSLALSSNGELWAWGGDAEGQLGNGTRQVATNEVFRTNVTQVVSYTYETNVTQEPRIQYAYRYVVTTNAYPIQTTLMKDYLDVIDYSVPANPAARPAVSIPGILRGISHGGALIYTAGFRQSGPYAWSGADWLDALGYDDLAAHLIGSLPLTTSSSLLVHDGTVYVAQAGSGTNTPPRIEAFQLQSDGKFSKAAAADLNGSVQDLAAFGKLLAVLNDNGLSLFDLQSPATLKPLVVDNPNGCYGFSLQQADGSVERGLWLPLGELGVKRVGP